LSLKIDLHVHTRFSLDSSITIKELVFYSRLRGLDGVAVTDHDSLFRPRELEAIKDLLIIPGAEITTDQGHVLAINPNTLVDSGLSFAETVDAIHDADGLAILAHPTAFFKGIAVRQLEQKWDAVEVINASAVPFSFSVRKNRRLATQLDLPQTGGSDAHYAPEIGMAYTCIDGARDRDDVIEALRRGAVTPCGRGIPWTMRVKRMLHRARVRRNEVVRGLKAL
jgi:predicted metal-dependent phosphoesterase TrpH